MWVNLAALGSCQLHFDHVSWQCLLACRQPLHQRTTNIWKIPAQTDVTCSGVLCCSSSAVDLRFCWSVPWSGAVSGWSLLLFCQKATEERTEEKLLDCCIPVRLRTSGVDQACEVRDQAPTRHRQWLCNEKAIPVLAGRRSEILEGCCKLFPNC